MIIAYKFFGIDIVFIKTIFRANPEVAVAVHQEGVNPGIAE